MPYKKEYNSKAMKMGKMPKEHRMGSQGHPAKIPVSHFKNKPQGNKPFPQG